MSERQAEPGERCTCGREARIVFVTERWGDVGWCGRSDGGRKEPCVFCGAPAEHETRCSSYSLRPPGKGRPPVEGGGSSASPARRARPRRGRASDGLPESAPAPTAGPSASLEGP